MVDPFGRPTAMTPSPEQQGDETADDLEQSDFDRSWKRWVSSLSLEVIHHAVSMWELQNSRNGSVGCKATLSLVDDMDRGFQSTFNARIPLLLLQNHGRFLRGSYCF